MTRQSLSRFLSDRRELRTFMTLPSRGAEITQCVGRKGRHPWRRGSYARPPPLSTREVRQKKAVFRQKSQKIGIPLRDASPPTPHDQLATPRRPAGVAGGYGLCPHRA